jgi:acetyltransferase-like isoleucine patch superfamily enzyme
MNIYTKLLCFVGIAITGRPRFISSDVKIDSFDLIEIGERVVISEKVILLTHDYSYTTALIATGEIPEYDISLNRRIKIGDNVFIGMGSIIMPGSIIGNNVIIGAGSVIRGVIKNNSVYIGNPAKSIATIQEYAEKCKSRIDSIAIERGQKA